MSIDVTPVDGACLNIARRSEHNAGREACLDFGIYEITSSQSEQRGWYDQQVSRVFRNRIVCLVSCVSMESVNDKIGTKDNGITAMKIREFLNEIRNNLASGAKDNEFSYWVEHTLSVNMKQFCRENNQMALEMNDTLPDICEQMEPGMESDKFHRELSLEVDRLLNLLDDDVSRECFLKRF